MLYRISPRKCGFHRTAAAVLATMLIQVAVPGELHAHEGHAALPSTGATVEGNEVLVSEAARKGLGLETATVTLQDLSRVLRVRADVELPWTSRALVTTLVPGRVQRILVKPGERIEAGQELARIESVEIETLQFTLLQAAEEVSLAERLLAQRKPLAQTGAIAGKSLLEAETQLRQKRFQLALAERKLLALGISQKLLEQMRESRELIPAVSVTSPMDGVIAHADVRMGQFVDTEQHLFNIVDRSQTLVVGKVLETDAWQVEPGQAVSVRFPALPDATFNGTVQRERLSVDRQLRVLEVVVPVENSLGQLRPEMSGRMEITVHRVPEAISCPTAALIETPERTFVLLRRGEGKYERREVQTGLRTAEQVEIRDGLFPGDRVIVTGKKLLASMFHTEASSKDSPTDGSASRSAGSASTGPQWRTHQALISQAVVEIPTAGKSFATSVIEGRVVKIHVEPGEAVQAGQLLAELDSQQLRSLQLELLETEEKLRRISTVIEQVEPLAASGSFPKSKFWEHQLEQKKLQFRLQQLERQLAMAGLSEESIAALRETDLSKRDHELVFATVPVRSLTAGRVLDFDVVLGQIVHENDSLFEVQDSSQVWIEGYVFERQATEIAVGQTADLNFPAYPELHLSGQVVRTAPALNASVPVLPVWIEVQNPQQNLKEGMLAEVAFPSSSSDGRIATSPKAGE